MPFDLAPLQPWHLYLFLTVFAVTFFLIGVEMRGGYKKIPRVGLLLLGIMALSAFFLIDDFLLRIGLIAAAIIIGLVGRADEVKPLSADAQFFWQLIIVAILVFAGWTIPFVSHPWGEGIIALDWLQVGNLIIPGSILAALWLLFFMNAINWIDGVDGLAGSVLFLAHGALVAVSLLPDTQDAQTLPLALIGAGALLAFLIWNFPPARVYLGTTGSWFMGLYVAVVAMQGGGKIITTLLILALPALDALFVIAQRVLSGKKPWEGDITSHLHHRLLTLGVTPTHITLAAAVITFALAAASILVPTDAKITILAVLVFGFLAALVRVLSRGEPINHSK